AGVRAGMIETIDDELQKLRVAEGLPGDVDGDAAPRRQPHAAAAERRQYGLHHPTIDVRHQPIALGRANELGGGCDRLTVLAFEAHEYLERRTAQAAGAGVHDGLVVELELVVAQRPR